MRPHPFFSSIDDAPAPTQASQKPSQVRPVQRYTEGCNGLGPTPDGEWVKYEDCVAAYAGFVQAADDMRNSCAELHAKHQALQSQHEQMRKALEAVIPLAVQVEQELFNQDGDAIVRCVCDIVDTARAAIPDPAITPSLGGSLVVQKGEESGEHRQMDAPQEDRRNMGETR